MSVMNSQSRVIRRKNNTGPFPRYKKIILHNIEVDQLFSYLDCGKENCIHPLDVQELIDKIRSQIKKQPFKCKVNL